MGKSGDVHTRPGPVFHVFEFSRSYTLVISSCIRGSLATLERSSNNKGSLVMRTYMYVVDGSANP